MRETIRNLHDIGQKLGEQNTENAYKNPGGNLRYQVVEKLCEYEEDSQWEEIFSEIPDPVVSQKTGEKPCESHVYGEDITGHSSLNVSLRGQTRCKTHEYKEHGEKPCKCKDSGVAFGSPQSFLKHEQIYTQEKPYACKQCDKAFKYLSSLQNHKRIHNRERNHACKQCGKSFKRQSNVQAHERNHTGRETLCV
ncbi:zinc finger protein 617, isoform CRA_b [Mus musculus]|nr:zinc finger protein 617, isoform CRA_b [Mus musculus]